MWTSNKNYKSKKKSIKTTNNRVKNALSKGMRPKHYKSASATYKKAGFTSKPRLSNNKPSNKTWSKPKKYIQKPFSFKKR